MTEEIIKFSQWLEVNGYAQSTRQGYIHRVEDFLSFVQGDGNIDQEKLQGYFLEIKNKFKSKTINCYRDAIGTYLKFKGSELKVPKRFKEEKRIQDTITFEEFEHLVDWDIPEKFQFPEKIIAILDLMLKSGLRKSEVCGLKRENIDLQKLQGKVFRPKCNDWHIFFFDDKTCYRLKVYFFIEPEEKNAFNIGRGGINHIFARLKDCFSGKNLTPHVMRHSLATKLLEDGVNLRYIQEILGHENISSTERYTKVNIQSLQEKYLEVMNNPKKKEKDKDKK